MSDVKRYEPSSHYSADFGMAQNPVGKWVRYDDHAQLLADLPKMVAWGRGLEHDKRLLQEENARLKAQVERLIKAGQQFADDMVSEYGLRRCKAEDVYLNWLAAKHPKP